MEVKLGITVFLLLTPMYCTPHAYIIVMNCLHSQQRRPNPAAVSKSRLHIHVISETHHIMFPDTYVGRITSFVTQTCWKMQGTIFGYQAAPPASD